MNLLLALLALPAQATSVCASGCDHTDLQVALDTTPRPATFELRAPSYGPVEIRGDVTFAVEVDTTMTGDPGFASFSCNPGFLFSGLLDVCDDGDLTVLDAGGRLRLDGQSREIGVTVGRDASLWLQGVDIVDGDSSWDGAGGVTALDSRAVTLVDVTTFATDGVVGGAIAAYRVPDVWIETSHLELGDGGNYGGLVNADGVDRLTLLDSELLRGDANYGGCLRTVAAGSVVVEGSRITGCSARTAFSEGGAVYHTGGPLEVRDSTIVGSGPQTGGGLLIDSASPVQIVSSVVQGTANLAGGAIALRQATDLDLTDTVVCHSDAAIGGGISGAGDLALQQVGFVDVSAGQSGPAVSTPGTLQLDWITVRASGGGGALFEADVIEADALVVDAVDGPVFGPVGIALVGTSHRLNLSDHTGPIVANGAALALSETTFQSPRWLAGAEARCDLELRLHPESPEGLVGAPDDPTDDWGMHGGPLAATPGADHDGDGHPWALDCDDDDPSVAAPFVETCNGLDDDCDAAIDEPEPGLLGALGYLDLDLDGVGGDPACAGDVVPEGGDCNDDDPTVPLSVELCFDGIDNDCDGLTEADQPAWGEVLWGLDDDRDGYTVDAVSACIRPSGAHVLVVHGEVDCDDADDQVHPGAAETCNGIDDDCDGLVDDTDPGVDLGTATPWYGDADDDGAFAPVGEARCTGDPAWRAAAPGPLDCDDADAAVHPGAPEVCNTLDDDCDGLVDDDDPDIDAPAWGPDDDGDGYAKPLDGEGLRRCDPEDGWARIDGAPDCDDGDPEVHPGAIESVGNPVDEDCDGLLACFTDADGDLHGRAEPTERPTLQGCLDGASYRSDDCDDDDAFVHPGAQEATADGIDQDCDGRERCYLDADGDGFGGTSTVLGDLSCGTEGMAVLDGDCNDLDPGRHPGADDPEGDGVDQDCDGVDPRPATATACGCQVPSRGLPALGWGLAALLWRRRRLAGVALPALAGCPTVPADAIDARLDTDGDGYLAASAGGDDCDDTLPWVHPGAFDAPYDGIDADCRGDDDFDADRDGFPRDVDCDDRSAAVYPGATERWYDGRDQDCDGRSDYDQDRDGFLVPQAGGGDCDDLDPATHPGAEDLPYDGIDRDCRGDDDFDADGDGVTSDAHIDPATGSAGADCDDDDPLRSPLAQEWCNGYDDDCDGMVDGATAVDATTRYLDGDGDGFGDPDSATTACVHGAGWVLVAGDCDDLTPTTHPGAYDAWYDGVDADCAGNNDCDRDGDGFAAANSAFCKGTDCGDDDEAIGPDQDEVPFDGLDNDCDDDDRSFLDLDLAETRIDGDRFPSPTSVGLGIGFADVDGDGLAELLTLSDATTSGAALLVFGAPPLGQVSIGDALTQVPLPASTDGFALLHELQGPLATADVLGGPGHEVFVGRPFTSGGGEVFVVHDPLGAGGSHRMVAGPSDRLGHDLVLPGDIDHDGFDDLVVGAPGAHGGLGAVWFVPGPLDADVQLGVDAGPSQVEGTAVAAIGGRVRVGDLDGDGVSDLVTRSRPGITDGDTLAVWFGVPGARPWLGPPDLTLDLTPSSHDYVTRTGLDLADLDGDGRDEVVLTRNPYVEPFPGFLLTDLGQLMVFDGLEVAPPGSHWLASDADVVLEEIGSGSTPVGNDVLALPDMDGDGLDELLWGVPLAGHPVDLSPSQGALLFRGAVFADALATGRPIGPADVEIGLLAPDGDGIGRVLHAGDLDGDGRLDLALGAPLAIGGAGSVLFLPAVGAL